MVACCQHSNMSLSYHRVRVIDGSSEVGPKLSEVTKPPEPLVRDDSLRKTASIREWDKGKRAVYGTRFFLS